MRRLRSVQSFSSYPISVFGPIVASLDVQEYDDASDVVNDTLFALPALERRAYETLCGTLCILLQVKGIYDAGDLLVLEELPDSVRGQHHYFVVRSKEVLLDLWDGVDADTRRHGVTERPRHGQPGYVFILQPHAHGPNLITQLVSVGVDSAVVALNNFCFLRVVRLVVAAQRSTRATCKENINLELEPR